jgi:hypothetical protein
MPKLKSFSHGPIYQKVLDPVRSPKSSWQESALCLVSVCSMELVNQARGRSHESFHRRQITLDQVNILSPCSSNQHTTSQCLLQATGNEICLTSVRFRGSSRLSNYSRHNFPLALTFQTRNEFIYTYLLHLGSFGNHGKSVPGQFCFCGVFLVRSCPLALFPSSNMRLSKLMRPFAFYAQDLPLSVLKEFNPEDTPVVARALDLGIAPKSFPLKYLSGLKAYPNHPFLCLPWF